MEVIDVRMHDGYPTVVASSKCVTEMEKVIF
jgi:hypothetical protein